LHPALDLVATMVGGLSVLALGGPSLIQINASAVPQN
jgi:hypothetical protein